mmetsp:Transcript_20950/g.38808  ORF Transcript_20950/g.38808 Transcript_20950/m.38808 type:complete len:236 (+) Transcript_20950:1-708(+)
MSFSISFERFFTLNSHTEYVIEIKSEAEGHWKFQRRYSALHDLNSKLADKVKAQLPSFPSKKWFGNQSNSFLTQRCRELQFYFSALVKIHEVLKDSTFTAFIKPKDKVIIANPKKTATARPLAAPKAEDARKLSSAELETIWQDVADSVSDSYISIIKASPLELQHCVHYSQSLLSLSSNTNFNATWSPVGLKPALDQFSVSSESLKWIRGETSELHLLMQSVEVPNHEVAIPLV